MSSRPSSDDLKPLQLSVPRRMESSRFGETPGRRTSGTKLDRAIQVTGYGLLDPVGHIRVFRSVSCFAARASMAAEKLSAQMWIRSVSSSEISSCSRL